MKLLRLHVEGFGTLQNYDLKLTDGLNTLLQENGWGKSTLAVFIKAMLYGLPASSKRSLDENERKKYTPWQGGPYGGSLELETAKGRFRIERFFGAKESGDTFALFDLSSNRPSSVYSAAIGEELFGIDAEGFERTTYLSQREVADAGDNNTVTAKLGNLLDDVDDIGNFDVALAALEKRRKFYVLTGNRGAIAEAEQERRDLQTELERCQRVKEAMGAQEQELLECTQQLHASQAVVEQVREQLKQAGLARERAALLEHKNKMLEELSQTTQQKKSIEARFNGLLPGEAEHREAVRLYDSIKDTHAYLNAIPTISPDADTMTALRKKYSSGFPTAEQSEALTRRNGLLRELRARRQALREALQKEAGDPRFAKGVPSAAQIENGFHLLKEAEDHQRAIHALEQAPQAAPSRLSSLILPVSMLAVGASLTLLSFLPFVGGGMLFLLIPGLLLLCVGLGLFLFLRGKSQKQNARLSQAREDLKRRQQERERRLQTVRNLLAEYGMPTDGDPGRALTQLGMLADQHRATLQSRKQISQELADLEARYQSLLTPLQKYFADVPPTEDYQPELDRLHRDFTLYTRLEAEDRKRRADRAAAEQKMEEMQQLLLPFLRRYDSKGTLRAGDCLEQIGELISEHRRLSLDIRRKEAELKAFITEKDLDDLSLEGDLADFDRLNVDEAELQNRITELQQRQARLRSAIDHLAPDSDKIPDLNAQAETLNQRIAEYKANSATITATTKLLEEAKVALSTRYLDGMQTSFRKYLSLLMGTEVPESVLNTSFEVQLREAGKTRSMESFSRGWRDAVRFCLRLALTAALYEDGEKPFLLLDDPFVNLDEARLAAARRLLSALSRDYQIIHMVCHEDRA